MHPPLPLLYQSLLATSLPSPDDRFLEEGDFDEEKTYLQLALEYKARSTNVERLHMQEFVLHSWAHSCVSFTQVIPAALNFLVSSMSFSALTPVLALKLYVYAHSHFRLPCLYLVSVHTRLPYNIMRSMFFWCFVLQRRRPIQYGLFPNWFGFSGVFGDLHDCECGPAKQHLSPAFHELNMHIYLFPLLTLNLTHVHLRLFPGCSFTGISCRPHTRRQLQKIYPNPALVGWRDGIDADW